MRKKALVGQTAQLNRIIGIRHRVKQTAEGESRPTQLAVHIDGKIVASALQTEEDELAFLREGLRPGDVFLMSLGGSGDRLAFALSTTSAQLGGCVLRCPPRKLKEHREARQLDKDNDATTLIELYLADSKAFYAVEPRDLAMIKAREDNRALTAAMKARMACEQQIRSRLIGDIFCNEAGGYPEGEIEQLYDAAKANDMVLTNLETEERRRENRLKHSLEQVPIYLALFKPIVGVGPRIAARVLVNIGDIRLFQVEPDIDRLNALKVEIDEIENRVYEPLRPQLTGVFAQNATDWQGKTSGEIHFLQLGATAHWLRTNGTVEQVAAIERAITLHQERSIIRRNARNNGRSKLKAFCGIHLINGSVQCQSCWYVWDPDRADSDVCPKCSGTEIAPHGVFPRQRRGTTCNWNPEVRQAMFLLGDQFNRRPNTRWGQLQREYKAKLRAKYPEPILVDGKKRYSDAHILRMATWKALSKFVEWLFDEWTNLEAGKTTSLKQAA